MRTPTIHATTLALLAFSAVGHAQRTGVSTPEAVVIDANSDPEPATPAATAPAKPSAAKPATEEVYGPYVPPKAAATVSPAPATTTTNADGLIVTSVPETQGELSEGTLLRVRMREELSTAETATGTKFTAEIMEPVTNSGRVIIPIGSILEGQVTSIHSGKRISGAASLHLEARTITLPDGTVYGVHAQLIDTTVSSFKVDREGTLKRKDRTKQTLAVAALATGGGAAAGALIGGGVGAVVGAGIGAGASTVMWLKQDRQAVLAPDTRLVFSLTAPVPLNPSAVPPASAETKTPAEVVPGTGN
jgi:hypothetical protein